VTAHDRHLMQHFSYPVEAECEECGRTWDAVYTSEYGQGWLEPEDCPGCSGVRVRFESMSDYDIAERRYEARGLL
jgi:hypothetical protein